MDITQTKEHLTGQLHGGTLNKVRNFEAACERAANAVLLNLDPVDTIRTVALTNVVHDDVYNYSLPSDFRKIIDLIPQDNRTNLDDASRVYAGRFDLQKLIKDKQVSIEGSEGSKVLRVNWRSRQGVTLHSMDSLTSNGTWSAVGSATGLKATTLYKYSGSASLEFDLVATGDGIQNTTMSQIDMTDEDEVADIFVPMYFGSVSALTSVSVLWGNDLTTNYWTSTAVTTQADGTAFRAGWNLLKFSWSTATETGTVTPTTIDSFRLTVAATATINNIRVDNIIFSIGRNFDIKYYSKFFFKNSSGTFIARPTSDEDTVIGDGDLNNIFLFELLKECAQQMEGADSNFDIAYATKKLWGDPNSPDPIGRIGFYAQYRAEYPSQSKKAVTSWSSGPRFR